MLLVSLASTVGQLELEANPEKEPLRPATASTNLASQNTCSHVYRTTVLNNSVSMACQ